MISSRFSIPVALLLAIALVPTVIHNYIGAEQKDDLSTANISAQFDGYRSKPSDRRPGFGNDVFDSFDWTEKNYTASNGEIVTLFVARSFDLKKLYHHPEIAIIRGTDVEARGIERLKNVNNIPLRVLAAREGKGLAAYSLLYDGEFIENPITFQLTTAIAQLFSARKPMTLFFAYQPSAIATTPIAGSALEQVLTQALQDFQISKERQAR